MKNQLIPFSDQLPEGSHAMFMQKLAEQLAKDLYPEFGEDIPENPQPDWIWNRLYSAVGRLISERSSALGEVLYRIDVSEKKINTLISGTGTDERLRVLSEQILEREAKKVWMRIHYSSK